jgi:DNA mismatch repair ATPase MutS
LKNLIAEVDIYVSFSKVSVSSQIAYTRPKFYPAINKEVGVTDIMAHIGSFVPAESA